VADGDLPGFCGSVFSHCRRQKSHEAPMVAPLFYFARGVLQTLMALEEISWGQRVLKIETTQFFHEHSDQKEINFHNVMSNSSNEAGLP
jgi:hypothetical protein